MRSRVREWVSGARQVLFGASAALTVVEMAPSDVVPDSWHAGVALAALLTHAAVVGIDAAEGKPA